MRNRVAWLVLQAARPNARPRIEILLGVFYALEELVVRVVVREREHVESRVNRRLHILRVHVELRICVPGNRVGNRSLDVREREVGRLHERSDVAPDAVEFSRTVVRRVRHHVSREQKRYPAVWNGLWLRCLACGGLSLPDLTLSDRLFFNFSRRSRSVRRNGRA